MNQFEQIIATVHRGVNPWTDYTPARPHTFLGIEWDDKHEWFGQFVEELKPRVIVEVGSFLGGSAVHFGKQIKRCGLDCAMICVDTWLAEEILWSIPEHRERLFIRHGRPEFYQQFMANVWYEGLADTVVPLPMASVSAARYLNINRVRADLIYIDGCHEECEAYRDIQLYWDLVLNPGGVMLIDDWAPDEMFVGLVRDVKLFVAQRSLKMEINGRKVMLRKP